MINTDYQDILTVDTFAKCMGQPNLKVPLSKDDIRNIKRHVNEVKCSSKIIKIKRVQELGQDKEIESISFRGHVSRSKISFIGYDVRNHYHPISEDWIELNFKEAHNKEYKNIMALKPGQTRTIEAGSSRQIINDNLTEHIKEMNIALIGPVLKYPQKDSPSCLPSSLASALDFIGKNEFAVRLMKLYNRFNAQHPNEIFDMDNIIQITKSNQGRQKYEPRWRFDVTKIKQPEVTFLLEQKLETSFFHCVLINNHVIVLNDKWIFDPSLPTAIPKDEQHLRYSAQIGIFEDATNMILCCYRYTWGGK